MPTCFLFTKYLNDNGCVCLRLGDDGTVESPPEQRSFEAIRALQMNARTLIVETSEHASLFEVDLPLLAEKKARAAIPYALEDELAQTINSLHFAFDRQFYRRHHYLVTVIDREKIQWIMHRLQTHEIEFEAITLDWFALNAHEMCMTEDTLLINQPDFKGALPTELAEMYLKNSSFVKHSIKSEVRGDTDTTANEEASTIENETFYCFKDSKKLSLTLEYEQVNETSVCWTAKRLLKSPWINLCQGEMQLRNQTPHLKKGYQLLGALAIAWLITMISVDLIKVHILNKKIHAVDQEIALIYKSFFPEAKQVISPKFRISQLLGADDSSKSNLWYLLAKLSQAIENSKTTIEKLSYQNNSLSVTITSPNFAELEQLENQLQQMQLHVNQTQAATQDDRVIATLELT